MTNNLAAAMPYIVDRIDVEQPGWELRTRLMLIVAWRTSLPGSWTELDLAALRAHNRDWWAARYDGRTLDELAGPEYRILRLRKGRPRLYRIAGDDPASILRWRGVPWIGGRQRALASVRARVKGATVATMTLPAGQSVSPVTPDLRFGHLGDIDLSANQGSQSPRGGSQSPRKDPPTTGEGVTVATSGAEPSPCIELLRNSLSLEASEGVSEEHRRQADELSTQLLRTITRTTGKTLIGEPARRVCAVADRHADRGPELLAFAATLSFGAFQAHVEALEGWQPGEPADNLGAVESTRRLLAIWTEHDPDGERTAELAAQLAALESNQTRPREH